MKKTLIYLIILVGLGLVALGAYLQKKQANSPEKERAFAVEDMSKLHKIHLKDKAERELTLIKKGNVWLIDGKENVRSGILNNLLEAIENIQAEAPVPKVAKNNVLTEMVQRAIEVNLYEEGEEKAFKSYYVGGGNHDKNGTFMLMKVNGKAASTPYLVVLPGSRGVLSYRFIPDREAWRSIQYTNWLANEVKSIRVNYIDKHPEESFEIQNKLQEFTLKTQGNEYSHEQINQDLAINLFNAFKNLSIEKYMNDYSKKDSVMQNLSYLDLEIESIYGDSKKLSVYYMPAENNNERLLKREDGSYTNYNADRLFAYQHENDVFVSIQFNTFNKIFLKGSQLIK